MSCTESPRNSLICLSAVETVQRQILETSTQLWSDGAGKPVESDVAKLGALILNHKDKRGVGSPCFCLLPGPTWVENQLSVKGSKGLLGLSSSPGKASAALVGKLMRWGTEGM